ASSFGLRCSMGTNAVLISEIKADELKSAGLRSGIVSLDGLEEKHNLIRGRSSFQLTLEGIERLRVRDIDVRVNVVVMRSNLSDIVPIVEWLAKRNVPVFMRRLILSGRAFSSSDEMLSATDYADLRARLKPLLDDQRGLVGGHYLKERHVTTRFPLPFARKDCSAGHRGLVILPDGKVQTCGFLGPLGEMGVGTLPAESLSVIWSRLNGSDHILALENRLGQYNGSTSGPKTNCLAVALSGQEPLVRTHLPMMEVSP
ncbi:MAG: radical SAM protein, partial [Patescibacteria group bacterium]